MSRMDAVFYLEDMAKFRRTLDKVGTVPQKVVTKAAGKGRTVVRRAVKSEAPVDTGDLKKGITSKGERSKKKGKKVYSIYVDVEGGQRVVYNPVHTTTNRKMDDGSREYYAYYPASQEFGFLTRSKGGGLSYVPGVHYMKKGAEQSSRAAKQAMIRTATDELEKEWVK